MFRYKTSSGLLNVQKRFCFTDIGLSDVPCLLEPALQPLGCLIFHEIKSHSAEKKCKYIFLFSSIWEWLSSLKLHYESWASIPGRQTLILWVSQFVTGLGASPTNQSVSMSQQYAAIFDPSLPWCSLCGRLSLWLQGDEILASWLQGSVIKTDSFSDVCPRFFLEWKVRVPWSTAGLNLTWFL